MAINNQDILLRERSKDRKSNDIRVSFMPFPTFVILFFVNNFRKKSSTACYK